jgi:hypothetical protein
MVDLTNQDVSRFNNIKNLYIQYGRFCEYYEIEDSDNLNNYDQYLSCGAIEWNIDRKEFNSIEENQLYTFMRRFKTGDYKAMLFNEEIPIINDDYSESYIKYIFNELEDNSKIEVGFDTLRIIQNDGEEIFLEGMENISDGEIIARKFLNNCDNALIVKDSLGQTEFRDDNFKDIKDYYNKCKYITNIRIIPKDNEYYKMNWDCIIVGFKLNEDFVEEIWQKA